MDLVANLPADRPPTRLSDKGAFPELDSLVKNRDVIPTSPDKWCSDSMKVQTLPTCGMGPVMTSHDAHVDLVWLAADATG